MSSVKIKLGSTGLASAVRRLRQALQETQEGMARRLGCTLSGYVQWEQGRRTPGGVWLLRMMALAPDGPTRRLFDAQTQTGPPPRGSPPGPTRPRPLSSSTTPAQRRQARELAREAIEILFELGEAGYRPADQKLKSTADDLSRVAGDFSRATGHRD